jgi:hypothetical protein
VREINPFAPPVHDGPAPDQALTFDDGRFFAVSRTKFVVMCATTYGLYLIYWFYAHWRRTKVATGSDIWPIARALFPVFFTHSLLRDVSLAAAESGVRTRFAVHASAWSFIALVLLQRLPDPYWLVSLFSFVPLIPVQQTVNDIHRRVAPRLDENASFTAANWVVIAIGAVFTALVLVGLFVPEEAIPE